jgi:predicted permease
MLPEASFTVLLESIAKLFLISAVGYLSVRFRVLSAIAIETLSKFIISISLPCLIIATVGINLHYNMLGLLGLGGLASLLLNSASILLALLFRRLFISRHEQGRNLFLSLSAIQNSGYLPIPLVIAVLPEHLRPQGLLLTFVYLMTMSLLFWSLGVWLVTEGSVADWRENLRKVINPPIIALLSGFLFLIPPIKTGFDNAPVLRESLSLIGNTTIPLVMFVLGGSFGSAITLRGHGGRIIGMSALVKLAATPIAALIVVKALTVEHTFGFVLVMQAAMPAAMNHIIVAREYKGNVPLIARALFVHYLVSITTIPLFLYLYDRI